MNMTYEFDAKLPIRDRQNLTLVRHTKQQMQLWVQRLPVNPLECGKELYQVLTELTP